MNSSKKIITRRVNLILALFFVSILQAACSTEPIKNNEVPTLSQSEYESVVEKFSPQIEKYEGLYNTINMSATLLNSEVVDAQLKQNARLYQWDKNKFDAEKSRVTSDLSKQTEVFLSFFTPESKHNDLHKNKTLWKIFLDADGKRYEGKATKMKLLPTEIQSLYPNHTRFAVPYMVSFSVPTSSIENSESKLTITGPVDSASVTFIKK